MAFRLAVSPQTIVSLETRFRGRIETLRGYLRVLGMHEVLARPSSTRRLIPGSNPAEADLVFTPPNLARAIIEELSPHLSGALLDPARGEGAFYDSFPAGGPRYWCELDEGRDFLAWNRRVDWVITNPPFSRFRDFLIHGMAVADNVVFLAPLTHFTTRHRIEAMKGAGFALRWIMLVPTPSEWPSSGFQMAAVWLQKGWQGKVAVRELRAVAVDRVVEGCC